MLNAHLTRRSVLGSSAVAVVAGVAAEPSWAAASDAAVLDEAVVSWIDRHAVALPRIDAGGPVEDLHPLRRIVTDALVVGLGESAHGTHEQFTLKHRAARFLAERTGFRTLAWEENWGSGVAIDRYVTSGEGDPRQLVKAASSVWQSEEMLDLVRWMRAYNLTHDDRLRFLGTDLTQLRHLLFDEIVQYVHDVAPQRLADLAEHLDPLRLRGTPEAQIGWYLQQPNQQLYIDHARAVYQLVLGLPSGPSRVDREYAVQHARTILGFYQYYATQPAPPPGFRDQFMADTLIWWQRRTQHRVIYWAANVHTAAGPQVTAGAPPFIPVSTYADAGSHLRQRYGRRYVSIGTDFYAGQVLTGWETGAPSVFQIPPPSPSMVDYLLGQARFPNYLLDLHAGAPRPVQEWLAAPTIMRIIATAYNASNDSAYAMSVPSLIGAFDAILHLDRTTPTRLL
jgi:erythromycin esterase-like protein